MKFLKLHLYQETNFNDHSLKYFKMGYNLAVRYLWICKDPCVKGLVSTLIELLAGTLADLSRGAGILDQWVLPFPPR